jgi:hypothetical protein
MTPSELIVMVQQQGGELALEGERIRYRLPASAAPILEELRAHREEVKAALQKTRLAERPAYSCGRDRHGKHRDFYGWRVSLAIDAICGITAREGLVAWLGENAPLLYRRLTEELPNEISRAWNDRVSPEYFDKPCFELVVTYRRAVEMRCPAR